MQGEEYTTDSFLGAFKVHSSSTCIGLYKAETMACAIAFDMAPEGDETILNKQGVAKATPASRKGTIKDEGYQHIRIQ